MKGKYTRIGIVFFLLMNMDGIIHKAEFAFSYYVGLAVDVLMGALLLFGLFLASRDSNFSEGKRNLFRMFFYFFIVTFIVVGILSMFIK